METLGNPWKPETGNPNPQPGHQRCRSTTPSCCKLHCCTGFTGTCSEPKKLHGLAGTGCCREASGCMVKYCNQSVRSKEFLARFRKEHEKETTFPFPSFHVAATLWICHLKPEALAAASNISFELRVDKC